MFRFNGRGKGLEKRRHASRIGTARRLLDDCNLECLGLFRSLRVAWGVRISTALALRHDGRTQTATQIVRQFVKLGVAVNLDGHLGCVADNVAVVAPLKMVFQLSMGLRIHRAVEVVCQLFQEVRARHFLPSPPVRFLKYLLKRSRNCSRARSKRDLTAGILKSKASAVSSVDRPSTSRSTNTVRKLEGNPCIVLPRISFSSPWVYSCSGLGDQSAISRGMESPSVLISSSSDTMRS